MLFRCETHLRPLEAGECDQVRIGWGARHGVALPDRFLGLPPTARIERFRVIGERVEVELRTEAREVAGVGGRVGAFPAEQGQAPHERVDRKSRVHM